jgi:hypothetical protein
MRSRGGRTKEVERQKWQHVASLIDSNWERTGEERNVRLVLEDIAKEVGASSITGGERISHNSLLNRVGASADPICDCSGYRVLLPEDAVRIPNRCKLPG